mmetsp:Transcript_59063/g.149980  ORF Transcript_59063/g.149980 Transcript_59063/m.149980 type:complete len:251 (-) Transcript_59063:410-1162(-)
MQVALFGAVRLHPDPVRGGSRGARGVVEHVVPRDDRPVESLSEHAQRRGHTLEGRGQVAVEGRPPIVHRERSHHTVVGRSKVARAVAPRHVGGVELPVSGEDASPIRTSLRHEDFGPVLHGAVEVGEAEVRRGEGDDGANHHVHHVRRVLEGGRQIDQAQDGVGVCVRGGAVAAAFALAQVNGVLPRRQTGREQPTLLPEGLDGGDTVGPDVDLCGRCVGAVAATLEDLAGPLHHSQPGAREREAVREAL